MDTDIITNQYIFHTHDKKCMAALEYVIYKYHTYPWFNSALRKTVTDVFIQPGNDNDSSFTIRKTFNKKTGKIIDLQYIGKKHYIVENIESYFNYFAYNKQYLYLFIISVICILIFLKIYIYIYVSNLI